MMLKIKALGYRVFVSRDGMYNFAQIYNDNGDLASVSWNEQCWDIGGLDFCCPYQLPGDYTDRASISDDVTDEISQENIDKLFRMVPPEITQEQKDSIIFHTLEKDMKEDILFRRNALVEI